MVAVALVVELILMNCAGIFIRKINLVRDEFTSQLSAFLMNVSLPCLVFASISTLDFTMEALQDCGVALLLSIMVCAIQFGLGQLYYVLSGKSGSGRIARYAMVIPHFSFMGLPVVDALFGDAGNLYYAVFLIPVRLIYYTVSKNLIMPPPSSAERRHDWKKSLKSILSPGLVVLPFAFIFWYFGWTLPAPIANCVTSLARTCSPLGLILCGLVLGKYDFKQLLKFRYFRLPIIRTILMPAIFFGISKILLLFGIDEMLTQIVVIFTALPIASLTASFVMQYDKDPEVQFEAAGNVMIATLLSTITIPLWYFLLQL